MSTLITFDEIRHLLVEELGLDPARIRDASQTLADVGLDSLSLATLMAVTLERYGFELGIEDIDALNTLRDVVDLFNTRLVEKDLPI